MPDLHIEPQTWERAGAAFEEAVGGLRSSITTTISTSTDTGRIGCTGGYAMVDDAIATLLGILKEVMDSIGTDIVDGIDVDGQSLAMTGKDHRSTEDAHVQLTTEITGSL